ncbi:hypothetical protein L202_01773, partial [Cryptococcus amylolentus CBS 6039]
MVNVFITGASGYVGSHVTALLLKAGHKLIALARSQASAKKLEDEGVTVIRASLEDTDVLSKAAHEADAVIHLGFIHDFSDFEKCLEIDYNTIQTFARALEGTSKTVLTTSGFLISSPSPSPSPAITEHTLTDGSGRGRSEPLTLSPTLKASGVRAHVLRLALTVHGEGDAGLLTFYIQQSKKLGFAGYLGEGDLRWPAVHVKDAARAFLLALENPNKTLQGGEILHVVQDSGVPFKSIAEAVAKRWDIPSKSLTKEEAEQSYEWLAPFFWGQDLVAESGLTRKWLGWEPEEKGLVKDLESSEWYFKEGVAFKY